MEGKVPEDKRDRGVAHSLPSDVRGLIRNHTLSFSLHESHYSEKKLYNLSTDLDKKTIWKLFQKNIQALKKFLLYRKE